MTLLRVVRKKAIDRLIQAGCDSARLDVDLLLEEVMSLSTLDLILSPNREINLSEKQVFQALLDRRIAREPVSQILGKRDFWSLSFKVSRDCLTPRPDSETLIEAALKVICDRNAALKILDLGTGSGCLLLSLMSELPHSFGTGVDISDGALALAEENARRLGFWHRCEFLQSDWAEKLSPSAKFDIILCNPPYIAAAEKPTLDPDVRDYEPHVALFAEQGGVREYQRLAEILPKLIAPGGHVFLEIGPTQGVRVVAMFKKTGAQNIRVLQDLGRRDRCVAFHF